MIGFTGLVGLISSIVEFVKLVSGLWFTVHCFLLTIHCSPLAYGPQPIACPSGIAFAACMGRFIRDTADPALT